MCAEMASINRKEGQGAATLDHKIRGNRGNHRDLVDRDDYQDDLSGDDYQDEFETFEEENEAEERNYSGVANESLTPTLLLSQPVP